MNITKAEVTDIAKEAAKAAVRETFRNLGVDLEAQDSLNEFRADLVHARRVRRLSEAVKGRIALAIVIGFLAGGIVTFADWIKAGLHLK